MSFKIGEKRVVLEYQVVVLVLISLGWSIYYLWSTMHTPYGGDESVLFIKPLVILLVLGAPFVIKSAVKVVPQCADQEKAKDRGIFHIRRIVFVFSIFFYASLLPCLGYLIPSVAYLLVMCFFLGLRKFYIFAVILAGYSLLLWIGFKKLMGVPIPVFPVF